MSDMDNGGIEIPEAAPEEFATQDTGRTLSPAIKFGLLVIMAFAVIVGALFINNQEASDPTSSISVDTDLDSTPAGVVQSESPQYQQILSESNDEQAQQALENQRTFIPTPEQVLRPIEDLEAGNEITDEPEVEQPVAEVEAPRPQPVVTRPPPPRQPQAQATGGVATQVTEEQENPYTVAILGQMSALSGNTGSGSLGIVSTGVTSRVEQPVQPEIAVASDEEEQDGLSDILIPAGTIIYGETLNSVNSDLAGSPILVELTTGDWRGARLIGGFTVADNKLVVQFNSMTTSEGVTHGISAFAVDGVTAEAAVASGIKRRYLSRYGSILGAAFVTSYASALGQPEQTLTTVGDETRVVEARRSEKQSIYTGLGAAAAAIGADLAVNAPRGPKIILRNGWPIAVMFTASVTGVEN